MEGNILCSAFTITQADSKLLCPVSNAGNNHCVGAAGRDFQVIRFRPDWSWFLPVFHEGNIGKFHGVSNAISDSSF